MNAALAERLRKAGIHHYDELIHDQPKEWLLKNFKAEGSSPAYPVNVSRLMRNLVWQMKERVNPRYRYFWGGTCALRNQARPRPAVASPSAVMFTVPPRANTAPETRRAARSGA